MRSHRTSCRLQRRAFASRFVTTCSMARWSPTTATSAPSTVMLTSPDESRSQQDCTRSRNEKGSAGGSSMPASARARTSRWSVSRASRSVSSRALSSAFVTRSMPATSSVSRTASSSSPRSTASGARSSWLASSMKARSRTRASPMRPSISLRVTPSSATSSAPGGTGSRARGSSVDSVRARRLMDRTGRSAAPLSTQAAAAVTAAINTPAAPSRTTSRCSVFVICRVLAADTTTFEVPSADGAATATTRSSRPPRSRSATTGRRPTAATSEGCSSGASPAGCAVAPVGSSTCVSMPEASDGGTPRVTSSRTSRAWALSSSVSAASSGEVTLRYSSQPATARVATEAVAAMSVSRARTPRRPPAVTGRAGPTSRSARTAGRAWRGRCRHPPRWPVGGGRPSCGR